jgi:endoglucanase
VSGRAAVFAVLVAALAAGATVSVLGTDSGPAPPDRVARDAGQRFLDGYVDDDGRVVRRDQGGDTVSEGQAYGMLIAVALDDEPRFRQIWWWTRRYLQRPDGLLAFRWKDGSVVDPQAAADADLDAAHALALAADRFDDDALAADARDLAAAVIAHETAPVPGTDGALAPAAGPWALDRDDGRVVLNPSYATPAAYAQLRKLTGDATWDRLDDGSHALVSRLSSDGRLPPDWAQTTRDGAIEAIGRPDEPDDPAYHGLDAARATVRAAATCDARWRDLAASLWDRYPPADQLVGRLTREGVPATDAPSPPMLVAAAGAADAADDPAADDLLDRAARHERAEPTYYSAAWVALGRLWLDGGLTAC